MKTATLILLSLTTVLNSCATHTPESYYTRTTQSTDILWGFGSTNVKSFIEFRDAGNLVAVQNNRKVKTISLQQHIQTFLIPAIDSSITQIEELKPTPETQDLINTSLQLYHFAKDTYVNEYLSAAQLIDAKENSEKIDEILLQLDRERVPEFKKIYIKLMQLSIPYAKQHDLTISRF
ncbi:hypothetical protein [Croceivirga sp. JEA036]|uniref:hypothetical protein n=1 Tax=Croceivirga sp. JEA036 TaxID=2721162 RepID=UPI00143971B4|nr:hypothetical protein [Croceivirga sp. JEA036]NJB36718.1 hypothetical protein [Croceivirga sp. JEA036]